MSATTGRFMRFFNWYSDQLKRNPLVANGITSGCISGVGDIAAQLYRHNYVTKPRVEAHNAKLKREAEERQQQKQLEAGSSLLSKNNAADDFEDYRDEAELPPALDFRRTFILTSYSLLIGVPFWHNAYKVVDWAWKGYKLTIPLAFAKGFTTWWFGFLSTPMFFTYNTTMEGVLLDGQMDLMVSLNESVDRMKREVMNVCTYGLCFWSIHWVPMFYWLPPHFRLVYASNVALMWSAIMSYILHKGSKH